MESGIGDVKVAAFDIGSNSIKMTVATVADDGSVTEGGSAVETVRLGEGVDRTGRLADDRMAAALTALETMALQARAEGAGRMIGVATEAVRVASNGAAFLDDVTRRTGIEITLISGDQEAALTYAGLSTLRTLAGRVVMIDIGGASTEVVAGNGADIVQASSIALGSGRLTDAFIKRDPPTMIELQVCREAAGAMFDPLDLSQFIGSQLIISGGTGTHLGAFIEQSEQLMPGEIDAALQRMTAIAADDLGAMLGIPPLRARVLPAGVAIVLEGIERLQPANIAVAPSGLRIGLLGAAAKGALL